jgi:hypothetical protein
MYEYIFIKDVTLKTQFRDPASLDSFSILDLRPFTQILFVDGRGSDCVAWLLAADRLENAVPCLIGCLFRSFRFAAKMRLKTSQADTIVKL